MTKTAVGFGPHLMMDLSGCPEEILSDLNLHFDFLNTMPERIGMTKITQPHVFPYAGLVPEDRGITGTVIIAESHLSVHSFELKGHAFVDIFSCKPFDIEAAMNIIEETFKPQSSQLYVTYRGREFHHTL